MRLQLIFSKLKRQNDHKWENGQLSGVIVNKAISKNHVVK